ncbi:hypothetical protein ACQJBY_019196 [Aegilops geniculata]
MDDSGRRAECAAVRTPKLSPPLFFPRTLPDSTRLAPNPRAGRAQAAASRPSVLAAAADLGSRRRDEGGRRRQRSRPVSVGACCWVQPARDLSGEMQPPAACVDYCGRGAPPWPRGSGGARPATTCPQSHLPGCCLPAVRGASRGPSERLRNPVKEQHYLDLSACVKSLANFEPYVINLCLCSIKFWQCVRLLNVLLTQ